MYQALYRKYRPRTFTDVIGQEHVTHTLQRQITSDRLSHAYLFVGTRGTGKTSCAKILAKAINCENPKGGDPCCVCPACIGIENGSILDVLELDAASNNGIDDVRALRDDAIYSPAVVSKRVYIIDEVHMLSNAAFNALLKILEEPPEHLVFVLATTALHRIPPTILSRCQRFSFKRISTQEISEHLINIASKEDMSITEQAAYELASLADGSLRDGISLLDQCASDTLIDIERVYDIIGLSGSSELVSLLSSVIKGDTLSTLDLLGSIYDNGRDMSSFMNEMAALVRDILLHKLSPQSPLQSGSYNNDDLSTLSEALSEQTLFSYMELIREAISNLSRSASTLGSGTKLTVELALLKMCNNRLSDDPASLLSRIEILEQLVQNGAANINNINESIEHRNTFINESTSKDEDATKTTNETSINQKVEDTIGDKDETSKDVIEDAIEEATEEANINSLIDASSPAIELSSDTEQENTDTNFWESIIDEMKDDISIYSLLSDGKRVSAKRDSEGLLILAADAFTIDLIESSKFSNPLKAAVHKFLGNDIVIRIEQGSIPVDEGKRSKIDELDKFDIVEFEQ
ncbi:MAG: DNA polymerase III subunit gamma/tau [Oscillospiraceae bacterium]|nr:DNA polymerase III subunit gamma/tau [Oscillospiraceae bacterium]